MNNFFGLNESDVMAAIVPLYMAVRVCLRCPEKCRGKEDVFVGRADIR